MRCSDPLSSMESTPVSPEDTALIELVIMTNHQAFDSEFFDGGHIVAAGVRTSDSSIYEGVSLPASIGRAAIIL